MKRITNPTEGLLASDEPWVRYRALIGLKELPADSREVEKARVDALSHPPVRALLAECAAWPGKPVSRHNDASLPMHKLGFLADCGLDASVPEIAAAAKGILASPSPEGALRSLIQVPQAYGGTGEPALGWMLCDSPVLLHAMLAFGLGGEPAVKRAVDHLLASASPNGWRCVTSSGFRGPGRRDDHCPFADLAALKALSLVPDLRGSQQVRAGVEAQLLHWRERRERKHYLFGMGTDFMKLKYPNVWFDALHVLDVLSRFPEARGGLEDMWDAVAAKQDGDGHFTPESVWMAWKGWSFAQKKEPSDTLTLRVALVAKRLGAL